MLENPQSIAVSAQEAIAFEKQFKTGVLMQLHKDKMITNEQLNKLLIVLNKH